MADTPRIGDVIAGKYALIELLGEGGMGVVYEAEHQRLATRVAIKILRRELLDNREYVARFEREARIAAKLRSEHAVRIYDVDVTDGGFPYMVMELLEGHDLAAEYELRGSIGHEELVDWIVQVCSALGEAHAEGIVHRDLKPSNVFLCHQSERCIAKVLDFGISKITFAPVQVTTTSTDKTIGTPRYMSPEQVRGARDLDGRSDLWSLGVLMYRLLAGDYPFDGESMPALSVAIATEPAKSLDVHCPDLPFGLVKAVMRALAKRPEDRFPDAASFAAAIAPFGTGAQPLPPRTSVPARASDRRMSPSAARSSPAALRAANATSPAAAYAPTIRSEAPRSPAPSAVVTRREESRTIPEASLKAQTVATRSTPSQRASSAALWGFLAIMGIGTPLAIYASGIVKGAHGTPRAAASPARSSATVAEVEEPTGSAQPSAASAEPQTTAAASAQPPATAPAKAPPPAVVTTPAAPAIVPPSPSRSAAPTTSAAPPPPTNSVPLHL